MMDGANVERPGPAVEWPCSRGRRSERAPKGQNRMAQSFNPGGNVLTRCALKEAPDFGAADRTVGAMVLHNDPSRRAPLSGRIVRNHNPGLKPWANLLCPFGARSDRWPRKQGHSTGGSDRWPRKQGHSTAGPDRRPRKQGRSICFPT